MAEYDSKAVNMGVSARLFDHFSLYAYCYDFKTVAGGIRYELTPRQRVFNPDEVRMPWDGRVELVLYPQISLGNFTNSRMGADLKLRYATPDDRWMFGLEGGVTGSSTFYEGKWQVSAWKRVSGAAEVRFRERGGLHPPFRTDDGRLVCHVHGGRGERRFPFCRPVAAMG